MIERFLTQLPNRFDPVDSGPGVFNSVLDHRSTKTRHAPTASSAWTARWRDGQHRRPAHPQHDLRRPPHADASSSTSPTGTACAIMALTDHDIVGRPAGGVRRGRAPPGLHAHPRHRDEHRRPRQRGAHPRPLHRLAERGVPAHAWSHLQESRLGRARKMVDKLAELGKPVDWERVQSFAGKAPSAGRTSPCALVEAGHVRHRERGVRPVPQPHRPRLRRARAPRARRRSSR